jgi:hypothetical protein
MLIRTDPQTWGEFRERVRTSPTEPELIGLLKWGEPQFRPNFGQLVREQGESATNLIQLYAGFAQYQREQPAITKAAAEALLRGFEPTEHYYFRQPLRRENWMKLFNLFSAARPHLKPPYVGYLHNFAGRLLSWVSSHVPREWWWDDDFAASLLPEIHQLLVDIGEYWLLFESREGSAIGALIRHVFRDLEDPEKWSMANLTDAVLLDMDDKDRAEAAKVLTLLMATNGRLVRSEWVGELAES